jgi:hypothetical protein
MKVSVCAHPECAVSVCCLVDFHGLAGLLAGVGGRTTPTSPGHTCCPSVKHHGNRYATLYQGLCGSPSFTTDRGCCMNAIDQLFKSVSHQNQSHIQFRLNFCRLFNTKAIDQLRMLPF